METVRELSIERYFLFESLIVDKMFHSVNNWRNVREMSCYDQTTTFNWIGPMLVFTIKCARGVFPTEAWAST
jgi:hypothetical protein